MVQEDRPGGRPEKTGEMSPSSKVYRGKSGQWAFVGHRVSGFLVFAFLLLHIVDVSLVRWPAIYNDVHAVYGNILLRLFEVGLLFALLFHSLNGLRIVLVDFFPDGVRSRLYRNVTDPAGGEVKFVDVTTQAGLDQLDQANAGIFADVDNDGFQDLFVARYPRTPGGRPISFAMQGRAVDIS